MEKLNLNDVDIVPIGDTFKGECGEPITKEFFARLLYLTYVNAVTFTNRYSGTTYTEPYEYYLNQIDMSKEDGVIIGMMDSKIPNKDSITSGITKEQYVFEYAPLPEDVETDKNITEEQDGTE